MAWYGVHKEDKTAPYPGMLQAVRQLKEAGVSVAVLSNKADEMAGPVVEAITPKAFRWCGGAPGVPTKPDTLLHRLMERMGRPRRTPCSWGQRRRHSDGQNGGLTSCGVLWGFRARQELEQEGRLSGRHAAGAAGPDPGEQGGRNPSPGAGGCGGGRGHPPLRRSGGHPHGDGVRAGANGLDPEAVAHIFEAKGRPRTIP